MTMPRETAWACCGVEQCGRARLVVGTFDTQGTAWLNSNSVLSFAADGSLVSTDATLLSSSTLLQLPTGGGGETNRSEYTDLEYNPTVSPYIYASYGGFDRDANTTINLLFLVDRTPVSRW